MHDDDTLADEAEALAAKAERKSTAPVRQALDVPEPASAPPAAERLRMHGPDDPRPDLGTLLNVVIEDVRADVGSWLLSGVGVLVSTMLMVFTMVACYFGGLVVYIGLVVLGGVLGGEDGLALGSIASTFTLLGVVMGGAAVAGALGAPIASSIGRAVLAHMRDGAPLTPSAGFSTITEDLLQVVSTALLSTLLVMMGLCFFYVGALVASFLLHFTAPAVVVHRAGPAQAVKLSVASALRDPGWHLGVWAVGLLLFMIGGNIPIVGAMIATPIWWALTLRAYVAVYGDADTPRALA